MKTTKPEFQLSTFQLLKLWFNTLFFNSALDLAYFLETLVTPCFWLVDHTTSIVGKFFVITVIILVSSIVSIAHLIGVPVYRSESPGYLYCFLIPLGYWILMNIAFNFYQACKVSPGRPMDPKLLGRNQLTICKKCIQPKPPRTHHCSICNTCYLKMDHHCPWINNCVGHFNHRYFYLTMVYITIGCLYMMIFGLDIAHRQIFLDIDVLPFEIELINPHPNLSISPASSSSQNSNSWLLWFPFAQQDGDGMVRYFQEQAKGNSWLEWIFGVGKVNVPVPESNVVVNHKANDSDNYGEFTRLLFGIVVSRQVYMGMIYMAALLCIGSCLALGGLSIWHAQLIGRGETSIEYHINKAQRKKIGESYKNPYDCGKLRNWEIFFGLDQPGKRFWKHILFPSAHSPTGNGYDWSYLANEYRNYYKEC